MLHSSSIETYQRLFVNRNDVWFQQWLNSEGKIQYACKKPDSQNYEPVSINLIRKHLEGSLTASWPSLDEQGKGKWLCFDSDAENGNIARIQEAFTADNIHSYRESIRPGRDGHLWLFFDKPIPGEDLLLIGRDAIDRSGVSLGALEMFPKTIKGFSQVRGPLGIHRKPGANNERGWFEAAPKNLEDQMLWLEQIQVNNTEKVSQAAAWLRHWRKKIKLQQNIYHRQSKGARIDLLAAIPNKRWNGKEWVAQCPVCATEGHDRSHDNLRIAVNGNKFCCVFGGPVTPLQNLEPYQVDD